MPKNDGGPVFPFCQWYGDSHDGHAVGMTLRDYFATAALTGIMLSRNNDSMNQHVENAVKCAYMMADTMLTEREKE